MPAVSDNVNALPAEADCIVATWPDVAVETRLDSVNVLPFVNVVVVSPARVIVLYAVV